MSNLFFVHTGLQVVLAHEIIIKNKLHGNCLFVFTPTKESSKFRSMIERMILPDLWSIVYYCGSLQGYLLTKSNISNLFRVRRNLLHLKGIINRLGQNQDKTCCYFGDMNNIAYLFIIRYLGIKSVSFFEDGIGHYTLRYWDQKVNVGKGMRVFIRLFYRVAFGQQNLIESVYPTEWNRLRGVDVVRFSVLEDPIREFKKEKISFGEGLQAISKKLKESGELIIDLAKHNNSGLFLSSTMRSLYKNQLNLELRVVSAFIQKYSLRYLYYKFHPKDNSEVRSDIKSLFNKHLSNVTIEYIDFDYPMEILMHECKEIKVGGYGSSFQMYLSDLQKSDVIGIGSLLGSDFANRF